MQPALRIRIAMALPFGPHSCTLPRPSLRRGTCMGLCDAYLRRRRDALHERIRRHQWQRSHAPHLRGRVELQPDSDDSTYPAPHPFLSHMLRSVATLRCLFSASDGKSGGESTSALGGAHGRVTRVDGCPFLAPGLALAEIYSTGILSIASSLEMWRDAASTLTCRRMPNPTSSCATTNANAALGVTSPAAIGRCLVRSTCRRSRRRRRRRRHQRGYACRADGAVQRRCWRRRRADEA